MEPARNAHLTLSVLKALDVLDCMHAQRRSLSPAEIGQLIGISRPTAHRLLATMANRGWVLKDPQDPSKYWLGYRLLQLAGMYLAGLDLRQAALPLMQQLSRACDESVSLWALDQDELVLLSRVMGSRPVQSYTPLGSRGCLHSKAVGKAILACMPESEAERILRARPLEARTPFTLTSIEAIMAGLAIVRQRGYGAADQEDIENLRAVGAAVLNFEGKPVGGLAISALVSHLPLERMDLLGRSLGETARQVSARLGFTEGLSGSGQG